MTQDELFERGLQRRRDVLGGEYVDATLSESDEFLMAFQRAVTEVAFPYEIGRGCSPAQPALSAQF